MIELICLKTHNENCPLCNGTGRAMAIDFIRTNLQDGEYDFDGVRVYISKKHVMHLIGKKVDYQNTKEATGFVFLDDN